MGKAATKKRRKTGIKILSKRRDDDMVVDTAPAAPLTGRAKHHEKVLARRALKDAKAAVKKQKWLIPKRTTDRKEERKALVLEMKALKKRSSAAAPAPAAPAPVEEDAAMRDAASPVPAFAYKVDDKKARKEARRRERQRARGL